MVTLCKGKGEYCGEFSDLVGDRFMPTYIYTYIGGFALRKSTVARYKPTYVGNSWPSLWLP